MLRQRPRDRRALRLAARQRVGALGPEPLDADIVKEMRTFVAQADQERGI